MAAGRGDVAAPTDAARDAERVHDARTTIADCKNVNANETLATTRKPRFDISAIGAYVYGCSLLSLRASFKHTKILRYVTSLSSAYA